ncbi:hypothetical protein TRVL_09228 [Trypanosoma vivax]|nr:hypothetical protein TRVL_09228 [Trypanosoma vivax]
MHLNRTPFLALLSILVRFVHAQEHEAHSENPNNKSNPLLGGPSENSKAETVGRTSTNRSADVPFMWVCLGLTLFGIIIVLFIAQRRPDEVDLERTDDDDEGQQEGEAEEK